MTFNIAIQNKLSVTNSTDITHVNVEISEGSTLIC